MCFTKLACRFLLGGARGLAQPNEPGPQSWDKREAMDAERERGSALANYFKIQPDKERETHSDSDNRGYLNEGWPVHAEAPPKLSARATVSRSLTKPRRWHVSAVACNRCGS